MTSVFQKICIFMLVAQALLFFVPTQSYVKYVRILAGMIMILQIGSPVLQFFLPRGRYEEILQQGQEMEREINRIWTENEMPGSSMGIYEGIEKELKERLSSVSTDYEITQVRLTDQSGRALREGEGENQADKVLITVKKKTSGSGVRIAPVQIGERGIEDSELSDEEEKQLKKLWGACIDVEQQRIEIRLVT